MMPSSPSQLVGISARCVLLTPAKTSPDRELLEALNRPDLALISTDNVYLALAELCSAARRDVESLKAGKKGEGLILLLSHPMRLADPAAVVHTAERYAPHASVWLFDPSSTPRLRAVTIEDLTAWTKASEGKAPVASMGGAAAVGSGLGSPKISPGRGAAKELSGDRIDRKFAPGRETGKDRQDGGLLSSEELAMLLAVDPPGAHNEHDRSS